MAVAIAVADDERNIPKGKLFDEKTKQPSWMSRYGVYLFLAVAMVLAIVLPLAIILKKHDKSSDPGVQDTGMLDRSSLIQLALKDVFGDTVFLDRVSPYRQALDWLIDEDPLQLPSTALNLQQRFILVYFYFSTIEDGPWISCNPPLANETETCYQKQLTNLFPPTYVDATDLSSR